MYLYRIKKTVYKDGDISYQPQYAYDIHELGILADDLQIRWNNFTDVYLSLDDALDRIRSHKKNVGEPVVVSVEMIQVV